MIAHHTKLKFVNEIITAARQHGTYHVEVMNWNHVTPQVVTIFLIVVLQDGYAVNKKLLFPNHIPGEEDFREVRNWRK